MRLPLTTPLFALITVACFGFRGSSAQAAPEAPPAGQPGLSLTFESTAKPGTTDARPARLVALYVPQNTPPTPFLPAGPFKATWEGEINVSLRGDYNFSAAGTGKLTVKVGETVAMQLAGDKFDPNNIDGKSTRLKKGKNPITITYESPATGDAWVRLYWSSAGEFLPEPISPSVFSHGNFAPLSAGTQLRQGRELFAGLRCNKCHATDADAVTGMPELAIDAPSLQGIGSRLNSAWMAQWVANPHALRPDTSMPRVLPAGDAAAAADVTAYLASLGKAADAEASEPKPVDIKAGGKLVASLGCIGCHSLPGAKADPAIDAARVPWRNVRAKYKPAALIAFLKQPEEHFQWIGMPNFHFSDDEAKKIAAFLLATSSPAEKPVTGDVARGEKLIASAGCVACHALGNKDKQPANELKAPALAAIAKEAWSRGCMGKDDATRGKAPDFSLSDDQRAALIAFAGTDRLSLKQDVLPEFAERQITSLRCIACHNRDERTDLWDDLLKEIASLSGGEGANVDTEQTGTSEVPGEPVPGSGDQSRPTLTWAGEKLRPDWSEKFISGKLAYKPRMWLTARMPSFATRAHGLSHGLSLEHGFAIESPVPAQSDQEASDIGRKLAGREGGLSCINCHGIGNSPPTAPFEAPSINFRHIGERLRKEYFDRWMRNPARIVSTTKMPAFVSLEDGKLKSALGDVFEGDGTKQFDALWQYLLAGEKIASPEEETK